MADNRVARGVRKVNETIVQDGRALILTEAQADKLKWADIPVGSIRINTSASKNSGTWSVKVEGETDWIPGGIKNDGTINIIKDSRVAIENYVIKQLDVPGKPGEFIYSYDKDNGEETTRHGLVLYENDNGMFGEYNQYGKYATWEDCRKALMIDNNALAPNYKNHKKVGYVFGLEIGDYGMSRNHLEVVIDDVLRRDVASGGVIELNETHFALADAGLVDGMEITARYIYSFRLGNPYPRWFINANQPVTKDAEIGDFWLSTEEDIDKDADASVHLYPEQKIQWSQIIGRPTTLKGFGITDDLAKAIHKHEISEINGLQDVINSMFTRGMIIDFYGSTNAIPSGWALCNGTNGTPDLRDRFVVGAGKSYKVGATGGENSHKLTVNEMPSHSHSGKSYIGNYGVGHGYNHNINVGQTSSSSDAVSYTGGNGAHENRPPYYALLKIMRL